MTGFSYSIRIKLGHYRAYVHNNNNKICRMSVIMPKAFLFGIKIRNKLWKTRNNLLTAKQSSGKEGLYYYLG
jgi:hypothetical protein